MTVVQAPNLRLVLDVAQALALGYGQLGLVNHRKTGLLHGGIVGPREFAVMANLADLESGLLPGQKLFDRLRGVHGRLVRHVQPALILPAEQGDTVFVGLLGGCHDGKPAVRDNDKHVFPGRPVFGCCGSGGDFAHNGCGSQIVKLRQVSAAIPGFHQPGQLGLGEVIAAVGAGKFIQVKPGLVGADKPVQGSGNEFLAHLGIVLGLQRRRFHLLRPDGHTPVGVCLLPGYRAQVVHLPGLWVFIRTGDKGENTVSIRAGDLAPDNPAAIRHTLGTEAGSVITGGGGCQDQLVAIGFRCVLQAAVGRCGLVQLQLVQVHNVGIKGVENVRLVGKGLKGYLPFPYRSCKAVAQGAVQHPKTMDSILGNRQAKTVQVVAQKAKPFHVLLQGAGYGLDLAVGRAVPQAQSPA